MSRLLPMLLVSLLCVGCSWLDSKGRPILQKGTSTEQQTIKQKENLSAKVTVQSMPTNTPGPNTTMDFFDHTISIPSNAKTEVVLESNFKKQQSDWYELIGSFNYKSGMGQLIFIGALCIAGGAVLCYFGMWGIGVGLAIFGFLLIGCGIAIESYPWVFVVVLGLGLLGVVGFVIYTIKYKKATTSAATFESVLAEVVAKIEALKKVNPLQVQQYITDELAKSNISGTIKEVVTGVKANV